MTAANTPNKRSSKPYDYVKHLVEIVLPAAGTAYFALAGIWDLPNATKVVGSIACLTTFLGVTLKVSRNQYYSNEKNFDGTVIVTEHPESPPTLTIPGEAQDALSSAVESGKKTVEFKVVTTTSLAK